MSPRLAFILASIAGFTAVAMGAFGAHAVRDRITPELLAVYETGSRYHLVHAVAMLAVAVMAGVLGRRKPSVTLAMGCFAGGICVFSGSLYVLALTGERWLGAVTPIGGVLLLAGWVCVGVTGWRAANRGAVDGR